MELVGVLEQPLSRLKELIVSDIGHIDPTTRLSNLQLDLKGDLNRFHRLGIPNRDVIGEPFNTEELWSFYHERQSWR